MKTRLLLSFLALSLIFGQPLAVFAEETAAEPTAESAPSEEETSSDALPDEASARSGEASASSGYETDGETGNVVSLLTNLHKDPSSAIDNLSGAFVWNYPLVLPPGRAGLTPELSLSYSSARNDHDSIVGYGWSLSIPSIERVNKHGMADLYTEDFFASSLSGELVPADSINYLPRTQDENSLSYSFDGTTWTATDRNGTVYTFGASADDRQDNPSDSTEVVKWMLSEIRDTNDNYISYSYSKNDNQIYPNSIIYAGNGTTDGIFSVDFTLEARSDASTSARPGFTVTTSYRISEIEMSVNATPVKTYTLDYSTGDNAASSLLSSITEDSQPPTTFNYQSTTAPAWEEDTSWELPAAFYEPINGMDDTGLRLVDITGDALPDLVQSYLLSSTNASSVYINSGSGWTEDTSWTVPVAFVDVTSYPDQDLGVRLFDANGDGLTDLVQARISGDSSGVYSYERHVYLNTGSGWSEDTTWTIPFVFTDYPLRRDAGVEVSDVNGDGLPDVIQSMQSGDSSGTPVYTKHVYLHTGSGWEEDASWSIPLVFAEDGYCNEVEVRLFDVNGDNLPDLVQSYYNGSASINNVYIHNGSGWDLDASWSVPVAFEDTSSTCPGLDLGVRIFDANVDGLMDLVQSVQTGDSGGIPIYEKHVYLNTGSGWSEDTSWTIPMEFVNNATTPSARNLGIQIQDVDGDGLVDFLRSSQTGDSGGVAIYAKHVYPLEQSLRHDALSAIEFSQGGTAEVTYQATPLYLSGTTRLNPDLPYNMDTVATLATDDGLGNTATWQYSYEGGGIYYNNSFDKQFAGFSEIEVTQPDGSTVTKYFHQDDQPLIGRMYQNEIRDSSAVLISKTTEDFDTQEFVASSGDHPAVTSVMGTLQTRYVYEPSGSYEQAATASAYDCTTITNACRLSSTTESDDGVIVRTSTFEYATDTNGILIGKPKRQIIANASGTTVKENKLSYDDLAYGEVSAGLPTEANPWITGTTYVETVYTYDAYGNVLTETDPLGNTTTYEYDAYNLYPTTITNALLQEKTLEYDYALGKPTRVVDVNGSITETDYDDFGRPTAERKSSDASSSTLVTTQTWTYNDTSSPRFVTHRSYWSSSSYAEEITYLDGFDRVIEVKTLNEDGTGYNEAETAYDEMGRVASSTLPAASASSAYDANTVSSDLAETYTYDALGRSTVVSNVLGTTTTSYDGLSKTVLDPLGNQKDYITDGLGRLTSVIEYIDGVAYTTSYEWNAADNLTKITDAMGNIRNFTYDGRGLRLTAEDLHVTTDTYYGAWTYTYDDAGNMTTSHSPNGVTVTYIYDDLNRVTSEDASSTTGTDVTYTYDSCENGTGQLCSTSIDGGASQSFTYFTSDRTSSETSTIASTSYTTNWTYDYQGNPLTTTHPDGSVVTNTYNALGKLESVVGVVSDIEYGPHGQVVAETYANGTASTYTYDATARYRLTRKQTTGLTASSSSTATFYPAAGDGAINKTSPSWDVAHDATSGTTAGSTTATAYVRTGKNAVDNYLIERAFLPFDTSSIPDNATITSANLKIYIAAKTNDDNDGDDFVTVVQASQPDTSTLTTADYDLAGSINTPTEGIDATERKDISSVTTGGYLTFTLNDTGKGWISQTGSSLLALREGHDVIDSAFTGSANQYNSLQFRTGEFAGTASDPVLEVTYTTPGATTALQDLNYTYDAVGNITQIIDASATDSAKTTDYGYDDLYRLTSATTSGAASGANETITYTYNILGNITYRSDTGTYTYAGATSTTPATRYANPHAVTSILKTDGTTKNFSYDANGNVKTDGTLTLTWDHKNRLATSKKGMVTTTFAYDATDARVSKSTSGTTTYYPSGDYSVKGSTTTVHIGSYATIDTTSGVSTTRTNHADHLGSTSIVTDSAGVMVQLLDYYPYGSERLNTGTADEQKTYIGEYSDDESGLSYLNARYYDPSRGMFLSQDGLFLHLGTGNAEALKVLRDPQIFNSYLYARGNPIGFIDRSGNAPSTTGSGLSYWECLKLANFNPTVAALYYMTAQNVTHDMATIFDPASSANERATALGFLALNFAGGEGALGKSAAWLLKPLARGRAIEAALGANLGWNFPIIDRFMNGIATSIKSMDLTAKTYQNMGALASKLRGYVDEVAGFLADGSTKRWGGYVVDGSSIQSRELQVVVPQGSLTEGAAKVFQEVTDYAKNLGVDFKFIEF